MKIDKLNLPIFLFTIAFFLEGLDAFSIFNIPLSWIGVVIYVFIFLFSLNKHFYLRKCSKKIDGERTRNTKAPSKT